jgi:3-deoxy-D-manno-octulosonic-acid transferase
LGALRHSLAVLLAIGLGPVLAGALAVRPQLRSGLGERFGRIADDGCARIWLHASSVGEAKAACRLLRSLVSDGYDVRASASTLTGRGVFRNEMPEMISNLAPLDHPWCVEASIRRGRPLLSVLIETELWPNWIAACQRHNVPVVVASGRLSDRSFPRYNRIRRLIRPTLRRIDAVGARTDLDAERFVALGVLEERVHVTGDLKLDPPTEQPALAIDLIRALAGVPVVIGGSTHPTEELALIDSLEAAEKAGNAFVLVLAPRQIERSSELVELCRRRQRRVHLRSRLDGRPLEPGEILILDTLGELAAMYATASIAFVGGSLVPVGGHNLVEPVHAGCPVLFGPYYQNARKVVEILEVGRAGECVGHSTGLVQAIVEAVGNLEACRVRGAIGRESLEAHRGSVRRTTDLIGEILESAGQPRPVLPGQRPPVVERSVLALPDSPVES